MNAYNERWTREKFLEFRKLKRIGWSKEMLIEHFGEDIYYSGLYNRRSSILPWLQFITEIKITPEKTNYSFVKISSDFYIDKLDYIIDFEDNSTNYVICFLFYIIKDIETYNILLTTAEQWDRYKLKLDDLRHKSYITDEERNELVKIVEKETGLNTLYSVMKKASYVIFDFVERNLGNITISIGETENPVKISLYRNIIKNSFENTSEIGKIDDEIGNKYFLYKINK
jgi:hypothetical protein